MSQPPAASSIRCNGDGESYYGTPETLGSHFVLSIIEDGIVPVNPELPKTRTSKSSRRISSFPSSSSAEEEDEEDTTCPGSVPPSTRPFFSVVVVGIGPENAGQGEIGWNDLGPLGLEMQEQQQRSNPIRDLTNNSFHSIEEDEWFYAFVRRETGTLTSDSNNNNNHDNFGEEEIVEADEVGSNRDASMMSVISNRSDYCPGQMRSSCITSTQKSKTSRPKNLQRSATAVKKSSRARESSPDIVDGFNPVITPRIRTQLMVGPTPRKTRIAKSSGSSFRRIRRGVPRKSSGASRDVRQNKCTRPAGICIVGGAIRTPEYRDPTNWYEHVGETLPSSATIPEISGSFEFDMSSLYYVS